MGQKLGFHLSRSLGIMQHKTLDASYEQVTDLYRNKLGVKSEFEGLENIPKEGRVIVFANHAGAHEQEFICDELNKKVRKGTKYFTYLSNKTPRTLGVVMSEADRERIIPGGKEIIAQHISEGNIMVIFPVGKVENKPYWVDFFFSYDRYKDRFKRGFIYLALENKCDLVPAYVDYKQPLWMCLIAMFMPKIYEKLWLCADPLPLKDKTVRVRFGQPIKYEKLKAIVEKNGYLKVADSLRGTVYSIGVDMSEIQGF